jgi:hypothetical protein
MHRQWGWWGCGGCGCGGCCCVVLYVCMYVTVTGNMITYYCMRESHEYLCLGPGPCSHWDRCITYVHDPNKI